MASSKPAPPPADPNTLTISLPTITLSRSEFEEFLGEAGKWRRDEPACVTELDGEAKWEALKSYVKSLNRKPELYKLLGIQAPYISDSLFQNAYEPALAALAERDDSFAVAFERAELKRLREENALLRESAAAAAAAARKPRAKAAAAGGAGGSKGAARAPTERPEGVSEEAWEKILRRREQQRISQAKYHAKKKAEVAEKQAADRAALVAQIAACENPDERAELEAQLRDYF